MARPGKKALARAALETHGRTYAAEIGFEPPRDKPSEWFRLLCASLLFSARISADIAVSAARALAEQGWTTAAKLADSTWAERAKVLNEAGYARYDERTSTMLGETAQIALDRYGGDLGLDEDAGALARLVDRDDFPRFVAALVRVGLADDADRVRQVAAGAPADGAEAGNGAGGASKSELYERAQKLGVSGRSRMSKQELAEAVERAEG